MPATPARGAADTGEVAGAWATLEVGAGGALTVLITVDRLGACAVGTEAGAVLTALVTVETAACSAGEGALGDGAGTFGRLAVGAGATDWTVDAGWVFGAGEGLEA